MNDDQGRPWLNCTEESASLAVCIWLSGSFLMSQHLYHLQNNCLRPFWVKNSADNIWKYFSYLSQKIGVDISCRLSLEAIYTKYQTLFSGKNKKKFHQGPVVQSIVNLISSLRVISLTGLADSIYNILIFFAEKMWVAFALQKLLTFFQQKISAYLRITRCKF